MVKWYIRKTNINKLINIVIVIQIYKPIFGHVLFDDLYGCQFKFYDVV
jgi:hypothetical protein